MGDVGQVDDGVDNNEQDTALLPVSDERAGVGRRSQRDPSRSRAGPPTSVGGTIGRYVALAELGRGAMGRVLRAYDPKLQREVALKLVHASQLSGDSHLRMVREARAMARLSHPNVVSVYDVEDASGTIMVAMEFVEGLTLRGWLLEQDRSWSEIVRTFSAAGQGLAAAHGEGLLHRDFKPANVLVAFDGRVKVTDFGLARSSAGRDSLSPADPSVQLTVSSDSLDDVSIDTALTQAGTVMGTPRYMAPEQHLGAELGPAVDQYGFCVALWEALCGSPPFTGEKLLKSKLCGPPRWPSDVAVPRVIVETIIRGLAPTPGARWPSMHALLAALAFDPAQRRRRVLSALGITAVLGLAVATTIMWNSAEAKQCRGSEAQLSGIWDEARAAKAHASFSATPTVSADAMWALVHPHMNAYAQRWTAAHTEACTATSIRGERSAAVLDLSMACLHRAKLDLRAASDVLVQADADVVLKAHNVINALPNLARCADVDALRADIPPPLPEHAEAVDTIQAQLSRAKALLSAGLYAKATTELAEAEAGWEHVKYAPLHTELVLAQARLMEATGDYKAAETGFGEGLRSGTQHGQWALVLRAAIELLYVTGGVLGRPAEGLRLQGLIEGLLQRSPNTHVEAVYHLNLATLRGSQGKYTEAESEQRVALELLQSAAYPVETVIATAHSNLGASLSALGRHSEAEAEQRIALALWRNTLGPDHPQLAQAYSNLAGDMFGRGSYAEAEQQIRQALALYAATLKPEHPNIASTRGNLATCLQLQDKLAQAEIEARRSLAALTNALGSEHPRVALGHSNLASILEGQGKYAEAEVEYRRGLALRESINRADHPDVGSAQRGLASVLLAQGRNDEAEPLAAGALAISQTTYGADNLLLADNHSILGRILLAQGNYAEAETQLRRALALNEGELGPTHIETAYSQSLLAELLLATDRADQALVLTRQAWAQLKNTPVPREAWANGAFVLARALMATASDPGQATRLARRAEAAFDAGGLTSLRDNVRAWKRDNPSDASNRVTQR